MSKPDAHPGAVIAGREFPSKAAAEGWVKTRLNRPELPLRSDLTGEDYQIAADLFARLFDTAPPARFFLLAKQGTRELNFIDGSGERIPLSIRKAIAGQRHSGPAHARVLRRAVEDQMRQWRSQYLAAHPGARCPLSGRLLTAATSDVDHLVQFASIKDAWLAQVGGPENVPLVTSGRGWQFADRAQLAQWRAFHASHARYRLLDREAHRAFSKRQQTQNEATGGVPTLASVALPVPAPTAAIRPVHTFRTPPVWERRLPVPPRPRRPMDRESMLRQIAEVEDGDWAGLLYPDGPPAQQQAS